jgi:hypothetical protein
MLKNSRSPWRKERRERENAAHTKNSSMTPRLRSRACPSDFASTRTKSGPPALRGNWQRAQRPQKFRSVSNRSSVARYLRNRLVWGIGDSAEDGQRAGALHASWRRVCAIRYTSTSRKMVMVLVLVKGRPSPPTR